MSWKQSNQAFLLGDQFEIVIVGKPLVARRRSELRGIAASSTRLSRLARFSFNFKLGHYPVSGRTSGPTQSCNLLHK